jgi:phosphopantetheine--protein transferase-like protein
MHRVFDLSYQLLNKALALHQEPKIQGLGVDVTEVERLRRPKGKRLASSFLTPMEMDYCSALTDPSQGWTVLWAAREAVYKATSGFLEIFPLSWRLSFSADGHWIPVPKKENDQWRDFNTRYQVCVDVTMDPEYAIAMALVLARGNPDRGIPPKGVGNTI